jgi:hypothetical protein
VGRIPEVRLGKTRGPGVPVFLGAAGAALALLVGACSAGGPVVQRPPRSGTIESTINGRASVGLVLGAGGSRGFAHVGVIASQPG